MCYNRQEQDSYMDYDIAFKQRVLEAAKEDIVYDATTGWVFWPWQDSGPPPLYA